MEGVFVMQLSYQTKRLPNWEVFYTAYVLEGHRRRYRNFY